MLINPISNNTNFQAVNQKYYQWAEREAKGCCRFGELLRQLRYDVDWGNIPVKDGIDTIGAIKKLMGGTNEFVEHVLDGFRAMLKK